MSPIFDFLCHAKCVSLQHELGIQTMVVLGPQMVDISRIPTVCISMASAAMRNIRQLSLSTYLQPRSPRMISVSRTSAALTLPAYVHPPEPTLRFTAPSYTLTECNSLQRECNHHGATYEVSQLGFSLCCKKVTRYLRPPVLCPDPRQCIFLARCGSSTEYTVSLFQHRKIASTWQYLLFRSTTC